MWEASGWEGYKTEEGRCPQRCSVIRRKDTQEKRQAAQDENDLGRFEDHRQGGLRVDIAWDLLLVARGVFFFSSFTFFYL